MHNGSSPFYWHDYLAETEHLSMAQNGAYLLLMAEYYTSGQPLPANNRQLYELCRAVSRDDREDVRFVLAQFFVLGKDGYRHQPVRRTRATEKRGR